MTLCFGSILTFLWCNCWWKKFCASWYGKFAVCTIPTRQLERAHQLNYFHEVLRWSAWDDIDSFVSSQARSPRKSKVSVIIKASSTGLICLIAVPLASMENSQVTRHAPYLDIFAEFRAWREKSSVEFLFHVRELGLDTVWKWCSPLGYKLAPERFGVPPKAFCGLLIHTAHCGKALEQAVDWVLQWFNLLS